ncbi:MAG TPA: hypothetical protein VGJ37_09960 [Pyrinomonadaceae bacterium]|jgi:hypothetical protein
MPNTGEQEMRSYLLGSLSPEREAELRALFQDEADLREELLAVEAELFDQYVAGRLSAEQRERFETYVLTSDTGQENLRFAENFDRYQKILNAEKVSAVHRAPAPNLPPVKSSSALFASFHKNPAFAVLLILLAALLITLVGWLSLRRPRANTVAKSVSPGVVQLAPGSMKSDAGVLKLSAPAKNEHVKLELELANSDFKEYKTQLFRENEAVESQEELKTEPRNTHYVVPVTVTGNILTPGDYQLKLSGVPVSGQPEFIDSYSFRVTTEDLDRGRLAR